MNRDKSIPERFLATSQEYNPEEDVDATLCIEDVQEVLDERVEEESGRDESQLASQMPVISDAIRQLQKRVAAMSEEYDPPTKDDGLPEPQRRVYSHYDHSDLETNLEGPSALDLYYSDLSSISITNPYNWRDILALCLFYTNQEVFDKMNLCREGKSGKILKLESHGTMNTAISRHCVFLAHAYQIRYDVLQYTWDGQRIMNDTVPGRKRIIKARRFSVIEQAKAYAIIDELQNYALGHSSLDQLDDASDEDLLSGKVSADGVRLSPNGKYKIIKVMRGGMKVRVVVDNRRVAKSRHTAT